MKQFYSFLMLTIALCLSWGGANAQTVTVCDGTATNSFVPIYGLYADYVQRSEFIIPSSELGALSGSFLLSMKFYADYD